MKGDMIALNASWRIRSGPRDPNGLVATGRPAAGRGWRDCKAPYLII